MKRNIRKYKLYFIVALLPILFAGCLGSGSGVVQYDLDIEIQGQGTATPQSGSYDKDVIVTITVDAAEGYEFKEWSGPNGDDVVAVGEQFEISMDGNKSVTAVFVVLTVDLDDALAPVELGSAGAYAILSKAGISTEPISIITGDIAVSPLDSTGITGFSLTNDATNEFATSAQVIGKVYASDYAAPTPANLTEAVGAMQTAYTNAAGRPANYSELHAGDLSGKTLTAGVYNWGTGVSINSDLTISGSATDVWIFQIAGGITQATDTQITLEGGALAENIFWQAADSVAIKTGAHFEGIVLGMTDISMGTDASVNGRLFAQTAVTLDQNVITAP